MASRRQLGADGSVRDSLSRKIDGTLKANAGRLPEPAQLEVVRHPVEDVIVGKPDANIWQRQACEFGDRGIGVRPDFRLALPIGEKDRFGRIFAPDYRTAVILGLSIFSSHDLGDRPLDAISGPLKSVGTGDAVSYARHAISTRREAPGALTVCRFVRPVRLRPTQPAGFSSARRKRAGDELPRSAPGRRA